MNPFDITTPAWLDDAVCASTDPSIFFPEQGGSTTAAKAICASCEARLKCLAWSIADDIPHGIYGGLTAVERRPLRKAAAA